MKTRTSIYTAMFCSLLLLTGLSTSASAGQIIATSYDLYRAARQRPMLTCLEAMGT